jgi:hypothetical protein
MSFLSSPSSFRRFDSSGGGIHSHRAFPVLPFGDEVHEYTLERFCLADESLSMVATILAMGRQKGIQKKSNQMWGKMEGSTGRHRDF